LKDSIHRTFLSATAESVAMTRRLAEAGIPSDDLHFVFIGDPFTPGGVWQHLEAKGVRELRLPDQR
jgi:hypothetical protein